MFIFLKKHIKKFTLLFILVGCQLQEPSQNHGILFLENRSEKLSLNSTNQNDIVKILGQPHSKSFDNDDVWIYIERSLSKGKYHKLGRHSLKSNNVLVLFFDKYGVLSQKKFYNKDDLKRISFSDKITENELSKKSFVEKFLSSVREKMYSGRK
tara:strand:- start:457 stop:918 length:462 start_codon:yes stop_codon:yes gene_type:complete